MPNWKVGTLIDPITYTHWPTEGDESNFIGSTIASLIETESVKPQEIAILIRTNRQSRAIEAGLMENKIPYRIIGAWSFWSREYTRAITSYLKLVAGVGGKEGAEALERAMEKPTRYLGKVAAANAARISPSDPVMGLTRVKLNSRQVPNAQAFQSLILKYRSRVGIDPISDILFGISEESGFTNWLIEQGGEDDNTPETNGDGQKPMLDEVAAAADGFGTDLMAFIDYITDQEGAVAKPSDLNDPDNAKVTVMTIHRSKGLEFPVVFAPGWCEGILPHRMAVDDDDIAEERRMAYVAITRTINALFVSSTDSYAGQEAGPSRFIAESEFPPPANL